MFPNKEKNIEFKYQGDSHYIDMNTLLVSQFHFSAIVNEFKNQLYPDINLKIKVKSFEKGSFDINQLFEISAVSALFGLQNINYISNLFSVIADYISIQKFLKGQKASETFDRNNKVEIHLSISGENNSITVDKEAFKIYQSNDIISEAFKQEAKILESDEEIKGIAVRDLKSGTEFISVPRDDFDSLTYKNAYLDVEEKEKVKTAYLGILRWETIPSKGSRWSFIYENRKIHQVNIRDEAFLKRIAEEGIRFGAGDTLFVDLLVKFKKEEYSGMFLEDKFEVVKVHQIHWRDEQSKMF